MPHSPQHLFAAILATVGVIAVVAVAAQQTSAPSSSSFCADVASLLKVHSSGSSSYIAIQTTTSTTAPSTTGATMNPITTTSTTTATSMSATSSSATTTSASATTTSVASGTGTSTSTSSAATGTSSTTMPTTSATPASSTQPATTTPTSAATSTTTSVIGSSTTTTTTATTTSTVAATTTQQPTTTAAPKFQQEDNTNQRPVLSFQSMFSFMKDNSEAEEGESQVSSSSSTSSSSGNTIQVVPLLPVLFNTLASSTIIQRDIISRVRAFQFGGAGGMMGASYSTTYKFFAVLAAAAKSDVAGTWSPSTWTDLSNSVFPSAKKSKPWIISIDAVRENLVSVPWNFPTSDVTLDSSGSIDALAEKLALGYFVAVLYQTSGHQNSVCATWQPLPQQLPWPLEQSRSMLALVVGVDPSSVYLMESCNQIVVKIPRAEFIQRWHGCEATLGCITGRAIYISSASVGVSRVLGNDAMDMSELRNARDDSR